MKLIQQILTLALAFPLAACDAETSSATQNEINSNDTTIAMVPSDTTSQPVDSVGIPTITLNNGYEMPIVGLGTYSLRGDVCVNAVKSALALGYRKFDSAYMYGNEEQLGQAIRESGIPRSEIFVATKLYPNQFSNPEEAIEQALSKLNIEYIDLMLLHHPGTNDVAAYKAIEKYIQQGKIRSAGLSNFYIDELTEFLPQISIKPVLVQNEIHPFYQDTAVVNFIQQNDILVEAWYPLGGRGYTQDSFNNETILRLSKQYQKSPAQIILRWHHQRGIIIIPGSQNPSHQAENIDIFDFSLTPQDMVDIAALNANDKHDWY